MSTIRAWAAHKPGQALTAFEYTPGPLPDDEVEVAVEHCGICHSDLSVLHNDWGFSSYPLVAGHEIIGRITATGRNVRHLRSGQRVGIGWASGSCMHCHSCMSGEHNLCAQTQTTMVGRHGGFAERVRAQAAWTLPLPDNLDPASAGPLLCGGVTVFTPFLACGVKPTDKVGVVGIGGLGHLAVKFARAWGCEVTAFTSSASKYDEARGFGAHHVVASRDSDALARLAGTLDFLLVTVNVPMDWNALMATLAPKGRMHVVGAVLEPIPVNAFDLIGGQRSLSGSPIGSPAVMATMLDFAARHGIAPQVERFPMSRVNEALARLESGQARYRIVLDADFS